MDAIGMDAIGMNHPGDAIDTAVFDWTDDMDTPRTTAPYLLLDASRDPIIPLALEGFGEPALCLFSGDAKETLGDVGPWLIEPSRHGGLWSWFVDEGWGHDWGIVVHSHLPLVQLKTRLKRFLKTTDEAGTEYFFKYYRPRHLLTYVPSFDAAQRAAFFRDIAAFQCEVPDATDRIAALRLDADGELMREEHDLVGTHGAIS